MICRRTIAYAATGTAVAIGAPLGWLAVRVLGGSATPMEEVLSNPGLYIYLLGSSGLAFACFGAALGFLGDQLARANAQLAERATTDPLTSLKNVRYFQERLRSECSSTDRDRSSLSLIILDVDNFKSVNDSLGHAAGDRVLAHISSLFPKAIRAGDIACRIGGEEFAVICPRASLREAAHVANRIQSRVETEQSEALGHDRIVTVSVGVATHSVGESESRLFRAADAAMYEAKRLGRNCVALDTSLSATGELPSEPEKPVHHKHRGVFRINLPEEEPSEAVENCSLLQP